MKLLEMLGGAMYDQKNAKKWVPKTLASWESDDSDCKSIGSQLGSLKKFHDKKDINFRIRSPSKDGSRGGRSRDGTSQFGRGAK
jgi:hypothetical protein